MKTSEPVKKSFENKTQVKPHKPKIHRVSLLKTGFLSLNASVSYVVVSLRCYTNTYAVIKTLCYMTKYTINVFLTKTLFTRLNAYISLVNLTYGHCSFLYNREQAKTQQLRVSNSWNNLYWYRYMQHCFARHFNSE